MRLNRKIRNLLIIALIILIAGAVFAHFLFAPPTRSAEIVPRPNGYDDFVAAGKNLSSSPPEQATGSLQAIKTFLSVNQTALELVHAGLTKEYATPTEYNMDYVYRHNTDLAAIKWIARAVGAEGRMAELENHPAAACAAYLSIAKIGANVARKGLFVDVFVSISIQATAVNDLEKLGPTLDADQCRKTIFALEKARTTQEPFDEVIARQKILIRSQLASYRGIADRVKAMIELRTLDPIQVIKSRYDHKFSQLQKSMLKLEMALAKREYQLEKGRKPDKWNDLVPAYLKTVPTDPATGTPMPFGF